MASTLNSFTSSEISMRLKEPYLTDGHNRKHGVMMPPGVYSGFRLQTSGSALSVQIVPDNMTDSFAVFQTSTFRSLSLRRAGTTTVDLSAYASKTVVLALYGTYSTGTDTTAEIRAYELSPADEFTIAAEKPQLVVLGTVVVPAAGLISSASITHDRRTSAWLSAANEATSWIPAIYNGGFEQVVATSGTYAVVGWETGVGTGGSWGATTTSSASGQRSLELTVSASPVTASATQYVGLPVVDKTSGATALVRVTCKVRSLIAPTGSANVNLELVWGDSTNTAAVTTSIPLVVVGATDASFRLVEKWIRATEAGPFLQYVRLRANAQTYGSTGAALRVDEVQVYIEPTSVAVRENTPSALRSKTLLLNDPSQPVSSTTPGALLDFDPSTPSNVGRLVLRGPGSGAGPALSLQNRIMNLGDALSDAAGSITPRLTGAMPNFSYTLLEEWTNAAVAGNTRVYFGSGGAYIITMNAALNSSAQWVRDNTAQRSTRVVMDSFSGAVMSIQSIPAAAGVGPHLESAWVSFAQFTGPEPTTDANDLFAPIFAVKDSSGNRRVVIDHNGFVMGRVSEIRQEWLTASPWEAWEEATSGAGTVTRSFFNSVGYYFARLHVEAAADLAAARTKNELLGPGLGIFAGQVHVLEWEALLDTVGASPGFEVTMGFMPPSIPIDTYLVFVKEDGNANWKVKLDGTTGTTTVVTSVAPVADTVQRFRLEIHGTGTPTGVRCLAYINGAIVAEITGATNILDQGVGLVFQNLGVSAGSNAYIGPVLYRFNRVTSEDAL